MNLIYKFVVAITFIGIMVCAPASASDWGTNSKNEHITNRLYQLLYGYVDICQSYSSTEAVEITNEANKFIQAHPELIKALNESPYFTSSKRKMDEKIKGMDKRVNPPCQEELAMLKQINNPEFKEGSDQAVNQWIADLAAESPIKNLRSTELSASEYAQAWLVLIDNGNYGESWDNSSEYFKSAITKDRWNEMINQVRKPLGKTIYRKILSSKNTTSIPGLPDGEYVVIQYKTRFENKISALETITPVLDKDGKWGISGYYIK